MKRISAALLVAVICIVGSSCIASVPTDDVDLLKQAVLTLSIEVNERDKQIEDLGLRLNKALALYDEAENDVEALQKQNEELRLRLDKALLLYERAEHDVDLLQLQIAELIESLEQAQVELQKQRASLSARTFLTLVAGAVGGAAAAILIGILDGSN